MIRALPEPKESVPGSNGNNSTKEYLRRNNHYIRRITVKGRFFETAYHRKYRIKNHFLMYRKLRGKYMPFISELTKQANFDDLKVENAFNEFGLTTTLESYMEKNNSFIFRGINDQFSAICSLLPSLKSVFGKEYGEEDFAVVAGDMAMFRRVIKKSVRKQSHSFIYSELEGKVICDDFYQIPDTEITFYYSDFVGLIYLKKFSDQVHEFIRIYGGSEEKATNAFCSSIYWTEDSIRLKEDVEFFSKSKDWFVKRGLPYARSYFLFGPPGNGKTSTIRAIGKFFGSEIETFSFTGDYRDPDREFMSWVVGESESLDLDKIDDSNQKIRILLLEDLDRFFAKDAHPKVSISCIMNALDGVVERKNSIFIATANHPERLDAGAFLRYGRYDIRVEFKSPGFNDIVNYLANILCHDSVSREAILSVAEKVKGQSFSFCKGIFMASANKAFTDKENSEKLICDKHFLCAAKENLESALNKGVNVGAKTGF